MYDSGIAEAYDLVYRGRGKDYTAEAAELARVITQRKPRASSLLDVACGTGLHLASLTEHFAHVEGVDLSADMLTVAKRRNPDVPLHQADMAEFDLGRTFDAVTCMFSSIALMPDTGMLNRAAARLVHHLVPDGVLVCEPWWFPATFLPGYVAAHLVEVDGCQVARMSHSVRDGGAERPVSRINEQFLVVDPEFGIRHFDQTVRTTLFDRHDYERAFEAAGCPVTYVLGGPSGRGLFIGVRP